MHRRYVVLAALLAFFTTALYSATALSCNAEGIGTSKQPTVATATVQRTPAPAPAAQPHPAPRPEVAAAAQPASVTPGAAAPSDDASGNLGDGVGATGTHKRGLRWQSFLPGVIK